MKLVSKYAAGAAAVLAVAAPALALAQDAPAPVDVPAHSVYVFNTMLFLISGFLVFFMACGFAMLEAGLVRTKNVAMQCTKNVALFSVASLMYLLVGYNMMYPGDGWMVQDWVGAIAITSLEPVGAGADAVDVTYASLGSDYYFQLMFCATTASIVSGTLAERIKLWPFLLFIAILTGVIYPLTASWKWGGGFLDGAGFLDFAGSTVVHACGGAAALAGAIVLGSRIGKYKDGAIHPMPGSSLPLATLGTFILWLGWFGFNGGSQLAAGSIGDVTDVSRIFANTNTAAAAGGVCAAILTQMLYGKVDLTMVLNGVLAGLVSITAEPLTPELWQAIVIGAVGGAIIVFTVPLLDSLRIDDVVGAIPVHLFAGIWGTFIVIWTNTDAAIGAQILGMGLIIGATFGLSLVLFGLLRLTVGIRVSEEDELAGLDNAEIGMEAYPEFGKGSQYL
ncbi:MAG: ammonium transporter [Pseudomonadota bacterium]